MSSPRATLGSTILWTVGGAVIAVALLRLAPAGDSSPLAGTPLVLPAVALLLWRAGRLAGAVDGGASALRASAALALVVAAAAAPRLGLRWGSALAEPGILAGLLTVVFWQAVVTLAALATPARSGDRGRRHATLLLTVFAVYLAILPWATNARPPDGDEPYYLLVTHSLAYDLDADLADNYERGDSLAFMPRTIEPQPGDPRGPDGQIYSRHNMTLPLLLAAPYRLGGAAAAFVTMALLTALLVERTLRLADRYFPDSPSTALIAAAIGGLAPPLLLYSHQVWAEVPAALCLVVAWDAALRVRRRESGWAPRALLAATCLLLPLIKLRFVAVAVPLAFLATGGALRLERRTMLRVVAGLLALTAVILVFNQAVFGNPLKYHGPGLILVYLVEPSAYLTAPLGLVLDAAFGLLLTAPLWLLVIPGLGDLWVGRRRLLLDGALLAIPYVALLGPRSEWYGGWSPPFRYGLVLLPVLILFLVPQIESRHERGPRFLLGFLGAATILLTLVALIEPGWTYNFGDGRSHLLDFLTRSFGADVSRFFPSLVRPRPATWIWALVALPLLVLLSRLLRQRASARTASWGVVALLILLAALPPLAHRAPLATIEFEDPYVDKTGGRLHPDRWTPGRVGFRGSWLVASEAALRVDLVPGGERFELAIDYELRAAESGSRLELVAGGDTLATVVLPPARGWTTLTIGPYDWPAAAAWLELRVRPAHDAHLLLDRGRLRWQ